MFANKNETTNSPSEARTKKKKKRLDPVVANAVASLFQLRELLLSFPRHPYPA
jgi:hypothetical protein